METSYSTHLEFSGSYVSQLRHPGLSPKGRQPVILSSKRVTLESVTRGAPSFSGGHALLSLTPTSRWLSFRNRSHVNSFFRGGFLGCLNTWHLKFNRLDSASHLTGVYKGVVDLYFKGLSFFLFHHPVPTAIIL